MPKPAPRVVAPTPDLEAARDAARGAIERAHRRVVESPPIVVGLRAAWLREPSELDTATARAIGDFLASRLGGGRWEPYRLRGWRWESIMLSTTEAAAGRIELVARTEADWHAATALLEGVANDLARLDGNEIEAAFGRRANWRTLAGEPRADLLLIDCLPSIAPNWIESGTLGADAGGFATVSTKTEDAAKRMDAVENLERILPRERPVEWAEIADLREALRSLLEAASVRLAEPAPKPVSLNPANWPTIRQLKDALLGVSLPTVRRIRTAAGIRVVERGGRAKQRKHPPEEVRRMIVSGRARDAQLADALEAAWGKWAAPVDSNRSDNEAPKRQRSAKSALSR